MFDVEAATGDFADIVRREARQIAIGHLLLYVPLLALLLAIFIAEQSALENLDAVHQRLNVVDARIVDVEKRIAKGEIEQAKRGEDIQRMLKRIPPR